MTARIRIAWWSLRVFPFMVLTGVLGFALTSAGAWKEPGAWILMALPVGLMARALLVAEFYLGERWMRIPGPHSWMEDLVPLLWWVRIPRVEPQHSEGRLVRLVDVAGWRRREGGIELRMKDGSARTFTLQGLRERDRKRVLDYLAANLGG